MKGIKQFNYPVGDLAQAKKLYSALLGVEPYADSEYYVGFRLEDQEIGLDPNGHKLGLTGPVAFFAVEDIEQSLKELEGAGAKVLQPAKNVGGGMLVAYLTDDDGNATGLLQLPE